MGFVLAINDGFCPGFETVLLFTTKHENERGKHVVLLI